MSAGHRNSQAMRLPRQGSKLREAYDALLSGEWTPVIAIASSTSALNQLRDFYGCEIVSHNPFGSRLLGRWDGPYFVPVERLHAGAA